MNNVFQKSLSKQNIPHQKFMTNPFILNNVLWYANAVNDSTLFTAEYSLFDKDKNIQWTSYPRNMQYAKNHPDKEDMKHFAWFDQGYSICDQKGDTLHYYAVKFGKNQFKDSSLENSFVFHYNVFFDKGKWQLTMTEPEQSKELFKKMLFELWHRIIGIK